MAKGYNLEQTGPQVQEAINKSLNLTTATQSKEGLMSAQDKQKLDSLDSELAGKVDKVQGKGLSTNDYDNTEKGKVASAYQKPVNGIPASDLADGVIPDTSQFITKTVNDLANYYLKTETYSRSETYTKSEVNALIALIKQFTYQVVSELPEASESTMHKLYLVPSADPQTQNVKDEYITVRSGSEGAYTYAWEQIGSTAINLSGYVTTEALNAALANYTTTANLTTLLAEKQDVIPDLSTIRSGANAGATAYQKPASGIPASDLAEGVIPEAQTDLVKYSTQSLTDAQKMQARTNIGAASEEELDAISRGEYVEAWDGVSEPVVAGIPSGVLVEYNSQTYTGTLAASNDTLGKIYLVATGTSNEYNRYRTSRSGVEGSYTYSWVPFGSTQIDLANCATKEELSQLQQEVTADISQLGNEVNYNEVNTRYNYIPGLYAGYSPKKLIRDTIHGLSEPIIVNKGDDIVWSCGTAELFTMCLFCYDEFGNKVDDWTNNTSSGIRVISDIMSAGTQNRYILRASFLLANASSAYVEVNGVRVWEPGVLFDAENKFNSLQDSVTQLNEDVSLLNETSDTQVVKLTGNANTFVSKTITLQKGRYIVFFGGTWGKTAIGSGGALFEIEVDGKFVVRCNVANASELQDCYFIEFDNEVSAIVGVRADSGNKVSIYFQNLTSVSRYLLHNNFQTSFDKAEGREFLFLGKTFVQADTASNGGVGSTTPLRVSQASLLEVPYPKAKLQFKLPNHIFAKMTFGDYSYQMNNEVSWVSDGQTLEVPEKVLYYRLTFARSSTLVASIGGDVAGSSTLSVDEILAYVNNGEIAISFDNISVFSACATSEQKLKVCMRNYALNYSSDRDKGFNYYPTLLHLTDTHGDAVRIRRALQYAKMLSVETVVLTGDIVCGDTRNDATYLKDIEDEMGIDIYPCVGNHDTYGTAIYDNGGAIGVNPAYRQWNTITKNVLTKPNVVSPAGIAYPTYYHFDNAARKLRFIALNLYEKGRDYTYSGAIYVSQQQINWLIAVLASTPQDYGVFIMMHQPEEGITKDNSYDKFFGVENYNPQTKLTGNPIRKIVDAFIGKTTIADSYTQFVDGISGEQETISYSADFTNVASGVDFIAYLTGHEHFDKIGYVAGATYKQLMLNITCTEAGYGNNYISAANISELPRENGSTQDAITIYVIDRDNKCVRLARLGSVITSTFSERDYLIIPFKD